MFHICFTIFPRIEDQDKGDEFHIHYYFSKLDDDVIFIINNNINDYLDYTLTIRFYNIQINSKNNENSFNYFHMYKINNRFGYLNVRDEIGNSPTLNKILNCKDDFTLEILTSMFDDVGFVLEEDRDYLLK